MYDFPVAKFVETAGVECSTARNFRRMFHLPALGTIRDLAQAVAGEKPRVGVKQAYFA